MQWAMRDSNPRPLGCKPRTLTAELIAQIFKKVGAEGFEPPTSSSQTKRDNRTTLRPYTRYYKAPPIGFEPMTHSLEGCCSNPAELRRYISSPYWS